MARRSVPEDIHYVDPLFPIPEGLVGYTYSDRLEDDDLEEPEGSSTGTDSDEGSNIGLIEEENMWYEFDGVPLTPDTLIVLDQQIRTTSTGNQVIDILVEIPNSQPMVEFEFKVAKI